MATRGSFQVNRRFTAGEDLSSDQFKAVMLSSGNILTPAAAAGDGADIIGILQSGVESGYVGEVTMLGYSKAIAGEAISIGDLLIAAGSDTASAAGRVLAATANGTTEGSEFIFGRALSAASAAGEVIEVWVHGGLPAIANRTG